MNPNNFTNKFVVTPRIRELAKEQGWPNPDSEVDAFIDYHEATGWLRKSGVKIIDREAAFRTWLRNAKKWEKYKPIQPPITQPPPVKPAEARPEDTSKVRDLVLDLAEKFNVRKKA